LARLRQANFFSVHDNRSDLQAVFMPFRHISEGAVHDNRSNSPRSTSSSASMKQRFTKKLCDGLLHHDRDRPPGRHDVQAGNEQHPHACSQFSRGILRSIFLSDHSLEMG
jgi:hypothetical protein